MSSALPSLLDSPSCHLLGKTALVVQALLGILVLASLLYKRQRERPMRPWDIWFFDVSKQVVGQLFVHGLNLLISDAVSQHTSGNACVFYFLNILFDTTFGVAFIYLTLHAIHNMLSDHFHLKGFESGVYGDPPSFLYWARQATVYVVALTTMKLLVLLILIWFPGLLPIGEWLLSWTHIGRGDSIQVIFVMGIFPIMMNIIQFWIIDSIVKAHDSHVMLEATTDSQRADHEPLFASPSDDEDDGGHVPYDIENPRSPSPPRSFPTNRRSHSLGKSDALEILPGDDVKSTHGPTDHHSYPPSLASSFASTSTRATSPKPAKNLIKAANRRRNATTPRSAHTPSDSHSILQPQPRIPQIASAAKSLELEIRDPTADVWSDSWDDSGDWTDGKVETLDSSTTVRSAT
ncbi:vacuolar membrane protein-domain-containing protein [Amanita rubescens]|nr:vacuolar membrane protein-domain-containing protein [Amanita rubescens]